MTSTARLLGAAHVETADGVVVPLERKAAALLAYLALEGATPRTRLTDLLWPETREASARNNLVHLLRKLRGVTGADLVPGAEVLSLAGSVEVDALQARALFGSGQYAQVVEFGGELLQGLAYEDCPELGDWVLAERERWRGLRAAAHREESARLEGEGRYEEAVRHAAHLLDLDPLSEDAWRRVMRLHYLRADRPAALKAYHRCQEVLRRELDVAPLPETAELAGQIERGHVPRISSPSRVPEIPLVVLRPPVLVGREREWALMEQAWDKGQFIYISGEPGVGKTRLARDFLTSKGEYLLIEGRPGDANQPGSSSVRAFRKMWQRDPTVSLESWVRREMSRYLPELALPGESVPPLTNSADVLHFRQAMGHFARAASASFIAQLVDDWQFFDDASVDDGMSFFSTAYPLGQPGGIPRIIATYRRGELSAASTRLVEQLVGQDMALHLELQPLSESSQLALLAQVGVPEDGGQRSRLAVYTGGNPLFLLETVKHLIESRGLEAELPDRLLPPGKVRQLLERRLTRLSPVALHAARAAAVLQRDFTLELVADVLNTPLLETAAAWEELEAAQITRGERFSHDLVYEAVAAGIPDTVRRLLHRSAARALGRNEAPPSRVAHHWLEGGDHPQTARWFLRAAEAAEAGALFREAAEFYIQASRSLDLYGQDEAARNIRARAAATPAALT